MTELTWAPGYIIHYMTRWVCPPIAEYFRWSISAH